MVEDNGTFKPTKRDAEGMNREELIKALSDISKKMYIRMSASRFKERATDDTFLKFVRAWSGLMQALNTAIRDEDLNTIEERLQALEDRETPQKERVYE